MRLPKNYMKMILFKKEGLSLRILIGFILGIFIGLVLPEFSNSIKFLGDVYLNLIKMLITPIVFCSVYCSIISLKNVSKLKNIGFKTILLFIALFMGCCIISLILCKIINPGNGLVLVSEWTGNLADTTVSSFFKKIISSNILQSFVSGETLPVILFTVFFGLATLIYTEKTGNGVEFINGIISLRDILYKTFGYFMEFSPIGVMSLIAFTVSEYGSKIFGDLAKYILTCWGCCIICFFIVLVLPIIFYTKISFKKYLKACGKVTLVAMSTSAATLPTTINTCIEDLKCDKDIVNFVAPLGCTINMCGGACSFMCLMMFVAQMNNIHLSFSTLIVAVLVATLMNMAAPGIPGGGIILGATFLSIIGLPLEFIGIYAGIYKVLDMIYTTMNVLGDVSSNVILNKSLVYESN